MSLGWGLGQCGWSELRRIVVVGSEIGDVGRVLVIQGYEGYKDFRFYYKSYEKFLEGFKFRYDII